MTDERDDRTRTPRRWTQFALGGLALIVGFGVAAAPQVFAGGDERITNGAQGNPRAIPTQSVLSRAGTASVAPVGVPMSEAPSPARATPVEAIDAFLGAEASGEFAASYGFLGADDRATYQSRAGWTAAHGQFPVVLDYDLGAVRVTDASAEVDATIAFKPELDPVLGLVPGIATATWVVHPEDDGWRVAYSESSIMPQYPSDDGAAAAARAWIADRAGCATRARAALLGAGRLADALCTASGSVRVDAAVPLAPTESSDSLLAAYGPDVFTWARVVPVTAPTRVGAVLAPLGSRWRVIGLVDFPALETNPQQGEHKQ